MLKGSLACIRKFVESDNEIRVMWNVGDIVCWRCVMMGCEMLGMWDVGNVAYWDMGFGGCGMLGCKILGMRHVGDIGCSGCGIFKMRDLRAVGRGMFAGMWNVDLENVHYEIYVYQYPWHCRF